MNKRTHKLTKRMNDLELKLFLSLNIKQSNNNPGQTFPPDKGSCPRLSQKVG